MMYIKIDPDVFYQKVLALQAQEEGDRKTSINLCYEERDVYIFLVDALQEAGIDASLTIDAEEYCFDLLGASAYVSVPVSDPRKTVLEAMLMLAEMINGETGLHAFYYYHKKEHFLGIDPAGQEEKHNAENTEVV